MKTLIMAFTLIASTHVYASESAVTSTIEVLAFSAGSSVMTTDGKANKEASKTINDAQNYIQSGTLSISLAEKIKNRQKENASLSTDEALDLIVVDAQKIIEENSK